MLLIYPEGAFGMSKSDLETIQLSHKNWMAVSLVRVQAARAQGLVLFGINFKHNNSLG
jgi:hypothetical protein